tara:strand:- start:5072 stop:5659 length:588 start_codon:yes stop_codon:yes gene_type:complete
MSIVINRFFSVPCSETELNLNLKKIKKYCYGLKKTDPGRNISNRDGWQSTQLFFPNPLTGLADEICKVGSKIFYALNGSEKYTIYLKNMWININPTGGSNIVHLHPRSFFSGVFYVQTPVKCGEIVLRHPCSHTENDWRDEFWNELTLETTTMNYLKAKENMLYIFPSWLEHYVQTNKSKKDRISISFNLGVIKK